MNNQFKTGDLAFIVGANRIFQNIGKACELVQLVELDELYTAPDGRLYRHADKACWIVTGDELCHFDGSIVQSDWALCEPRHLRALLGDFQPERQQSREVLV